jgi:hypothetical protein
VKPSLTVSVHSPTSSPSSAHSPRMASLLSALQGIIGPHSPEKAVLPAAGGDKDNASPDASDASPLPHDAAHCAGRVSRGTLDDVFVQTGQEDVAAPTAADNDLADDPQSDADATSPPGLLSPVQIGSVPPVPFPHVALGLGATLSWGDSIDSGYADTWVGPTPFSLSPPHLSQRNSTLDLLSSPFGSSLFRVLPRRLSPSPTRQRTTPDPRDSVDLISPPISTTTPPIPNPSRTSPNGISLMYDTQSRQSPDQACPSGQGGAEDVNPSNGMPCESNAPMDLSPAETLSFSRPPSEIPVLKYPAPMASYDNLVDPQLVGHSIESSSSKQGDGAPSTVEGTVEAFLVSEQPSSVEPSHVADVLSSPPPPMDAEISSPLSATVPLQSPVSLQTTPEVAGLDYEALYQSLVMSPEEAASKRMSWASRPSPPPQPPRAASTDSSSAACSTSALVDIPERPHTAVDVLPWSRQRDLPITPILESGYTSHTSSPPPETPISSGSSRAGASASSVHVSPDSQSASLADLATQSPSSSTSRRSWRPPGNQWPQSAPISAPLREVTSTLNNHSEVVPARSQWDHVSTSRKVPFGFRRSLVVC